MPSSMAVFARPVRIFARSRLKDSTAFFMPSSASLLMSLIIGSSGREARLLVVVDHGGPHLLAAHDALDVATGTHVENDDAHVVVATELERGAVHDLQLLVDRVLERH